VISGLGIYHLLWSDHLGVPNPDGAGEWRSVPLGVKRVVVRGNGPVLIGAVFVQLAAGVMLVVGLLSLTKLLVYPLSAVGYYAIVGSWVLALASWGIVEIRARMWRRKSSPSRDHAKQDERDRP
jgi:hypothetical protein